MSAFFIMFTDVGEWVALDKARALLKDAGFSVGPNQHGAPTAAMFGDYAMAKWRNLNRDERAETHAVIEGDTRNGPVRIRLLPACPDEGVKRLEVARSTSAGGREVSKRADQYRPLFAQLGERVKAHRKALDLTLEEVGKRAGLTKSYVWEIERGSSKNPTVAAVWGLASALGVSPETLLGLRTDKPTLSPFAMKIASMIDARDKVSLDPARATGEQP